MPRYTGRKYSSKKKNTTQKAIQKYVKSAIKVSKETKMLCLVSTNGLDVNSTGASLSTFTIPQGDTSRSRDGDYVNPVGFRMKYILQADNSDDQNAMRIMVIQSKKGLLNTSAGPGWFKCHTQQMLAGYKVLYDRTHIVNAQNGTQETWTGPFYVNIKDKNLNTLQWAPNVTSNTEPNVKGAVYVFIYSSSAIAPSPTIYYDLEMRYQEK